MAGLMQIFPAGLCYLCPELPVFRVTPAGEQFIKMRYMIGWVTEFNLRDKFPLKCICCFLFSLL